MSAIGDQRRPLRKCSNTTQPRASLVYRRDDAGVHPGNYIRRMAQIIDFSLYSTIDCAHYYYRVIRANSLRRLFAVVITRLAGVVMLAIKRKCGYLAIKNSSIFSFHFKDTPTQKKHFSNRLIYRQNAARASYHMCPLGSCKLTWLEYWNAGKAFDKIGS